MSDDKAANDTTNSNEVAPANTAPQTAEVQTSLIGGEVGSNVSTDAANVNAANGNPTAAGVDSGAGQQTASAAGGIALTPDEAVKRLSEIGAGHLTAAIDTLEAIHTHKGTLTDQIRNDILKARDVLGDIINKILSHL